MTEKRFRTGQSMLTDYPTEAIIDKKTAERWYDGIKPNYISSKEIVKKLNQYEEENEQLKQSNKDAIQLLKNEFDFAYNQRQKHLDDPVICNAYDIIRYTMRKALDKLGDIE